MGIHNRKMAPNSNHYLNHHLEDGLSFKDEMIAPYDKGIGVNEIMKLDLKKGDVLLVKVPDQLPQKVMRARCQDIREQFKKIYGDNISLIFIHNDFDISVIRLEEWFV